MPQNIRAGIISGNPLTGLCHRVCIEVKRVYDGCRENFNNRNYIAEITPPPQATPPFTFVRAENFGSPTVNIVGITAVGNRSSITMDVTVPVIVTFSDAHSDSYTAVSQITLRREPILSLPQNTIAPYNIEVFAAFQSLIGNFLSENAVSITGCLVLIYKVIVISDILVPTYGNCEYPECGGDDDVCDAFLSRMLFP